MSSCPILTKNELNIQVSNDNSGVKTVGDVIKKMRKATSGGRRRRGGSRTVAACTLILASAMLFGLTAFSYKTAAAAYQAAGVKLSDIKKAQATLDAAYNQQCSSIARTATTALAKDEGLLVRGIARITLNRLAFWSIARVLSHIMHPSIWALPAQQFREDGQVPRLPRPSSVTFASVAVVNVNANALDVAAANRAAAALNAVVARADVAAVVNFSKN